MRHSLLILMAAGSLAGCASPSPVADVRRAIESVHVPVVTRQDFAFDAAAPDGSLSSAERARLDGWFQGLGLTYGDVVYAQGVDSADARNDIARVAGRYGLAVADGGPVLAGQLPGGMVRIVVSRTRAVVPGCPDWDEASQPNHANHQISNFGCANNSNMAAMIANPEDLIHGRANTDVSDARIATKAIDAYRNAASTGTQGLMDVSKKGLK